MNHHYCEASEQLFINKRCGPGSTGVRPALQSLHLIHFLVKGPLPLSYRSPWRSGRGGAEGSRGEGVGGIGRAVQTPLAAHSMVINDHPTGADSELAGERRKHRAASPRANVRARRNLSEGCREGPGCFLLWLEIGDRMA